MVVYERISEDSKVVILLNLNFEFDKNLKIVTDKEFWAIESWLKGNNLSFSKLYDFEILSSLSSELALDEERIVKLLSRDFELSLELVNLNQQGIWILTYLDAEYPKELRKHLKKKAPKILFGSGDIKLLSRGGLSVLSSNQASKDIVSKSLDISSRMAKESIMLLIGGNKGVEDELLLDNLKNGGSAVLFVSNNLLERSLRENFINPIKQNRLCIVSAFHPRSGFAANKMEITNIMIFSLSDYILVLHYVNKKAGIFSAIEKQLKKKSHIPIFALDNYKNKALIEIGAKALPPINDKKSLLSLLDPDASSLFVPEELF